MMEYFYRIYGLRVQSQIPFRRQYRRRRERQR